MTSPNNTVAGLAEKWREAADDAARTIGIDKTARAIALTQCADELTTLLSEHGGGGEVSEAELIALVAGPYYYHHKMDNADERVADAFNRCREMTIQNIKTWCAVRAMPASPTPSAPVGVEAGPLAGKYGDLLRPFVAMMNRELHANAAKGERGWLQMDRKTVLLEIFYHVSKLMTAARDDDQDGIREYGADVANMAMMLVDVCDALPKAALTPPAAAPRVECIKPAGKPRDLSDPRPGPTPDTGAKVLDVHTLSCELRACESRVAVLEAEIQHVRQLLLQRKEGMT